METKLLEFKNKDGEVLRGIFCDAKSDKVVLCVHGFERTSVSEPKFKRLSDALFEKGISSFRFDFSGCGISDGDFKNTTIDRMTDELALAIEKIKTGDEKISVVTHSLAGCVLARFKDKYPKLLFEEIVLIAPALNQKELLRFYFAVSKAKRIDKNLELNWNNFMEYFSEEEFLKSYESEGRMSKSSYFPLGYFKESKDVDYSKYFSGEEKNILHIHGDRDSAVPLESLNIEFKNNLIVKGGNHDLEKPDMQEQWLRKAVDFLRK